MTTPQDGSSRRDEPRDHRLLLIGLGVIAAWVSAFVLGLRWFMRLARGRGR